jgi:hypothetical protein
LAFIWVNAAVPETKGRSLEEIEALLVKGYEHSSTASTASLLHNQGGRS